MWYVNYISIKVKFLKSNLFQQLKKKKRLSTPQRIFKNGTNELIYKVEIVTDVKKKKKTTHTSYGYQLPGGKGGEER